MMDDNKYHKRGSVTLVRRLIRSALNSSRRTNDGLMKALIVLLFCSVVVVTISRHQQRVMSVNVDIEVSNEIESLGFADKNLRPVEVAATNDDSIPEDLEEDFQDNPPQQEQEEEQEEQEEQQQQDDDDMAQEMILADISILDMTPMQLYENYKDLQDCPDIFLPPYTKKAGEWWALKHYMRFYSENPIKQCIPRVRAHVQFTLEEFTEKFRRWGQPVVFHFENLRKIGFKTRSYTMEELLDLFPLDPNKQVVYEANKKFNKDEEIDLAPAIRAIMNDGSLKKMGVKRNFPRNMKVKPSAMSTMGVEIPPLVQGQEIWQTPSLWMGTSTSGTAFHHDCCDNFVMMITGTKRFTLAPPTDWHTLSPKCIGKLKNLCYANIPEPNQPGAPANHYNKAVVDVHAGEILYMPAGYFHHIENLGPTVMTNCWTRSKESVGILSCNK